MPLTILTLSVSLLAAQDLSTTKSGARTSAPPKAADLVLRRGSVYTLDAARSWAGAVAVSGGRIVFVGAEKGVGPWIGPETRVVDLRGAMLLPAFHDSHVHPISGGLASTECLLDGFKTEAEIREAVRRHADENPGKPWIRGRGWQLPVFPAANPHKSVLDEIVPDRPVYLVAADGHSAWVNSKALAIAGITAATADPPGGKIERDKTTGEPTGTLREGAMDLIAPRLPRRTAEERLDGLRRGLERAASLGITSLQESSADEEVLEAYAELDRRGELTARVVASHYLDSDKGIKEVPRLVRLRERYKGRRLRADAVKIFVDGVIESRTAALLEPYEGFPEDRGLAFWEPRALVETVTALDREGFQVHVHAIGDRAVRMTLDAFEAARAANGARDSRHHIAHLQLVDPRDIPRFRRLGVIANFQPLWAQADPYILQLTVPVLGPRRSRWLYPIASLAESGATVAFGSDWPVTSLDPLEAMQVAITRRDPDAGPGPSWIPEERIGLAAALAGYTIHGAYLAFREKETGSIEVGKAADLVALDRDLFEVPASEIHLAKVLLTILDGRVIYEKEGPPGER